MNDCLVVGLVYQRQISDQSNYVVSVNRHVYDLSFQEK